MTQQQKKQKEPIQKAVTTQKRYAELFIWVWLIFATLVYFRYMEPKQKLKDAARWWRDIARSYFEKPDFPMAPYLYMRNPETALKDKFPLLWDGNIANLDEDTTLQIFASNDNYPNGRKDIPFRKNKVIYAEDSTTLPMYWCAPCPAWIEIRYSKPTTINRIEITPNTEVYGASEYQILVLEDQSNNYIPTTPVSEYQGNAGSFKSFNFKDVTTSRVRIIITRGGTGNDFAYIKDIKIFEKQN